MVVATFGNSYTAPCKLRHIVASALQADRPSEVRLPSYSSRSVPQCCNRIALFYYLLVPAAAAVVAVVFVFLHVYRLLVSIQPLFLAVVRRTRVHEFRPPHKTRMEHRNVHTGNIRSQKLKGIGRPHEC